jgi:hypothetical protein
MQAQIVPSPAVGPDDPHEDDCEHFAAPLELAIVDVESQRISFIGVQNAGFQVGSSTELFGMIYASIKLGQVAEREGVVATPEMLFPWRSRHTTARRFNFVSAAAEPNRLRPYQDVGFACMGIDAGCIHSLVFLDIVMLHPFVPAPPVLFKSIRDFQGTRQGYRGQIRVAISEFRRIVGDNLPVQIIALTAGTDEQRRMMR